MRDLEERPSPVGESITSSTSATNERFDQDRSTVPARDRSQRVERLIDRVTTLLRRDRRVGFTVAAGAAATAAVVVGWWTPRGPLTTSQAVTAMVIGAVVGALAGVATRSRWALLLAPVVFVAVFELVRIGADGPTVDAIRPGSTYGVLAFVVERVFHGLVALVPMMIGAAFAAAWACRHHGDTSVQHGRARAGLFVRRTFAVATTLGMVGLAVGIARPAGTDQIRVDGEPVPASIAELIRVDIGGHDLALMIRGASTDNPILLYLAGGPGGSELGAIRNHLSSLEQDFLVVTWDQRGTGKSYPHKEMVLFGTSGHRPLFEQPAAFQEFMVGTVLADTAPST